MERKDTYRHLRNQDYNVLLNRPNRTIRVALDTYHRLVAYGYDKDASLLVVEQTFLVSLKGLV